jgi:hypothetical protein
MKPDSPTRRLVTILTELPRLLLYYVQEIKSEVLSLLPINKHLFTYRLTQFKDSNTAVWVPGAFSLGVKRPGREANLRLVPRSKNEWSYISTPPIRHHGVVFS